MDSNGSSDSRSSPERMWRRYLLGNPVFLSRVLSEARRQGDTAV